jgi:ADP-ribose pyrophosphatase
LNEELYNDGTWRIVRESASLPDGRVKRISRVYRCDAVSVLAFTDKGNVLLIREFRPYYGEYVWMLPTGKVDKENEAEVTAQRELQEEAGFRANEITPYCTVQHAESIAITHHIFIAKKLESSPLPQDAHEMIEVHELSLDAAIDQVLKSPIVHSPSAYALLRYAREHP